MVRLEDTFIRNREMVVPSHANNVGTAHGGNVMKWMDEIGALSAMRFAGETCVTARMDQIDFRRPIDVGDTALIEAYVFAAGETSVRVRVRANAENPRTGETELTTESYAVYVAIDDEHDPAPVPDLEVSTDREERLRAEALDGNGDA